MEKKHFCTCRDVACPLNPNNPERAKEGGGCDACVRKNLARREIPSCFFRLVKDDLSGLSTFTFESFAKFLKENGSK